MVKREFRIHDPSSGSARILIAQLRNEDASTERGGYSCSHGAQSPCAPNRPPLQVQMYRDFDLGRLREHVERCDRFDSEFLL